MGGSGTATTSYGTCDGDWYVWSVNITDGTSNTLMVAEDYIGHLQSRHCGTSAGQPVSDLVTGTYSFTNIPAAGPASIEALAYQSQNYANGAPTPIGHTRWTNGGVYYSGFTTADTPNQPMDWDSVDENDGGPTYMSLASNSNHPGGVNALFADGSVHFIKNSIGAITWHGLGTISGGEVISSDSYQPGGVNAYFADGSVHFLEETVGAVI
jgi:prepilin-type processing-associated H-X9-DG protein